MKRVPESGLPISRASLPEGCSDLIDAYRMRIVSESERDALLLRIAALFHDKFVEQLDPAILQSGDSLLVAKKVSDFLHPVLLTNPDLEKLIRPNADLVDTLVHVAFANYEADGRDT